MRNTSSREKLKDALGQRIAHLESQTRPISGILDPASRDAFISQLVDSVHRVEYVAAMKTRQLSEARIDPTNEVMFNPLLAAIYAQHQGETEEAFWLIFLFTHFGQNQKGGWRYAREVYGRLGQGGRWEWETVSQQPSALTAWINLNLTELSRPGAGYGNHRKYESLGATGRVAESYVEWVQSAGQHSDMIQKARTHVGNDPAALFDWLYQSMSAVRQFGRTAKFDYLTMVGKMGLAPITPGKTYVAQATGPRVGGRLLFGRPDLSNGELEQRFTALARALGVGPQVIEDAVCNWQKSPQKFVPFRG